MSLRKPILGALLALQLLGVPAPVLDYLEAPAAVQAVQEAGAAVPPKSVEITPSVDGVLYSRFPDGDGGAPTDCDVPSGWACLSLGDGGGSIIQASATEWNLDVVGTHSVQKQRLAHITGGSGDVQLVARITDTYAGNLEPLASVGIGLREGLTDTSFFHQCFSPFSGNAAIQSNYGTTESDFENVNGASGQSRPRYVAMTYDKSQSVSKCHASADGSAWTEVASVPYDFSAVYVSIFGQSKSATSSLQATIDNIDLDLGPGSITVYTPTDPDPDDNLPVLVSQIPNQNLTEGINFTTCFASHFSEPDGELLTYSADLPSGTGLTFNTSTACFSGAPDATDVSASPYNVEFCAADPSLNEVCDIAQFTVSEQTGDTISWTIGMPNTRTCAQLGAGPGDIVVIEGDGSNSRANLTIQNCTGTASSPITFRNDTTENSPLDLDGSSTFGLTVDNSSFIVIDGSGKWDGASSNGCGNEDNPDRMQPPPGARNCGIVLSGSFQSALKVRGNSRFVTVRGVECDGTGGMRSCFALNDHTYKLSGVTQLQCQNNPNLSGCEWREGWVLENNYCHDTDTECFYVGSNANTSQITDLPLRNNHMRFNYVKDAGWDAISMKSNISASTGRSSMHDNYVDGAGVSQDPPETGNSGACYDVHEGAHLDIYNNVGRDCFGAGVAANTQNRPSSYGSYPLAIFNNVIVRAGEPNNGKRCINVIRKNTSVAEIEPEIFHNTCVEPDGSGINVGSTQSPCTVTNNVLAAASSGNRNITASHCSPSSNTQDTVTNLAFDDAGSDDYRLTSGSPARNTATPGGPGTDFEGTVRPQQGAPDRGADEYQP